MKYAWRDTSSEKRRHESKGGTKHGNWRTKRSSEIKHAPPKIKRLLWNSLVRSAPIYGLRARGLPRHIPNKMEVYMDKHLRTMANPRWEIEVWYTGKKHLYKTHQPSTMESRINKTQIKTTQTQGAKTIHPKGVKRSTCRRSSYRGNGNYRT